MSKKCIKCGQPLPDNASFCPHCTAVQKEKQEIKAPKQWRKAAFGAAAVVNIINLRKKWKGICSQVPFIVLKYRQGCI